MKKPNEKKIVKILYEQIDNTDVNTSELVGITEVFKNELCYGCYIMEDSNISVNKKKEQITQFLLKIIGDKTGQALGSYYLSNKGIDSEIDTLVMNLTTGI